MGNHYHLLIETIEANISEGMRDLNKNYSQAFNRLHKTVGHLTQGRYKSFIIEKEVYLLEVARYIVLNPVRAGLVKNLVQWKWSSYLSTIGFSKPESFLATDWILGHFGNERKDAQQQFKEFVISGIGLASPFGKVAHRSILGSPQFIYEMWEESKESAMLKEIPREERNVGQPSLEDLFSKGQSKKKRDEVIVLARIGCGYSVAEIARHIRLSESHVSRISRGKRTNDRGKT